MNNEEWDGEVYIGNYKDEIKECLVKYRRETRVPMKDFKFIDSEADETITQWEEE